MRKHALKFTTLIFMALAVTVFGPQRAAADEDDPPTRVARLSVAEGSVSFEPAGTDEWVSAAINRPLTTGDKLWADHDSRAELHLGSASIRLGANTGFSFLNLDDNTTQLQLTEGTLRIRVRRLTRNEIFEVDTPNLAFTASRPGIYRINVNDAGDTTVVVVRDGEGEVTGGGQSYRVHSDETGIFTGTDQLNADIEGVGSEDDLERWSYERDRREDHSSSRRYVSDEAIGYEDLDEYGGWRATPEYGTIWFPHTTVVGWAPYRYGHWVWIAPWGYTWVDDEPWGFAPFHYGRWVTVSGSWGWVPCRPEPIGVAYVRPVYAPALVAWVGGPHIAIGIAVGGGEAVGWFPLGPREVYLPAYHVSRAYVNNVNVTNTTVNTTVVNNYYNNVVVNKTTVNNVTYVNQRVPGAVTATSTQVMTTSQPVGRNVMRVDERQIGNAQVTARTPAVAPERQAFTGGGRPTQARPPERVVARAVVARTAPPPPPARVDRQQELIRQNGGQSPAISQMRTAETQQTRAATPVRMAPPSRPATSPQRNVDNRAAPAQNSDRPAQQQSNVQPNNRPSPSPANSDRPNNNAQPNRPPNSERPNTAPPNPQPNRPPSADRPNERNDRPPSARPANPNAERPNTPPPSVQPNRPANNDRPNAERPNTAPPNTQPNRPANNERPNTPPPNVERPNTPPPNVQPNRPPNPDRPNERNDRPPSARPANPPPNGNPQLEQQHQRELENMRRQQDQERQRVEQQQTQQRQRADQQRADDQRRQQMQEQQQRQLQDLERKHEQAQQQVQQRQQQEHQQQRPPQAERQQPPPEQRPPQAERQQPPPRQQQQQPPPRQQDKPKEKDKPPKG
jgi:hypothetical protein